MNAILDARNRRDELQLEFATESLLHDLHVEESEKAAAKAKPESGGRFRLILKRCVVELKLLERVTQLLVLLVSVG